MKVWSGSAWAEKPVKVWSGSAWVTKPVKVWNGSAWRTLPAVSGPTDRLITAFTPGADRDDHTGEVGARIHLALDLEVSWIGVRYGGGVATREVNLYEWFSDTLLRTVTIDLTGKTIGEFGWASIAPLTLVSGEYYALMAETASGSGATWASRGAVTMKSPIDGIYSVYRIGAGGLTADAPNEMYVGVDLGWTGSVAPAFRSIATTAYGSRSSPSTVSKPSGVVADDILLLGIFTGTGGAHGDVTTPSGFTKIGTSFAMTDTGFYGRLQLFWKRATGSEPSSYSITHDSGATRSTEVALVAYSGCVTSGDPVDVTSSNVNTGPVGPYDATMLSVTTTQANDKLVWFGSNWDATGGLTPPTGMAERYDHLLYVSDETIATAGATGNRTQTQPSANPWAVYGIALKGV